jgi:hypothetical protein
MTMKSHQMAAVAKALLLAPIFALTSSPLASPSFAGERGGAGPGGGRGFAAEVQRVTDIGIAIVEANRDQFAGVNVDALKAVNDPVQIIVSPAEIRSCEGLVKFDALSANLNVDGMKLRLSEFDRSAWLGKDSLERLQITIHERFVITGYEKSNQYSLTNKVTAIQKAKEESASVDDFLVHFQSKLLANLEHTATIAAEMTNPETARAQSETLAKMFDDDIASENGAGGDASQRALDPKAAKLRAAIQNLCVPLASQP